MASSYNPVTNAGKYKNIFCHNSSAFVQCKEVWVNNGTTFVEPKQIWVHNGTSFVKKTNTVRYITFDGSSTRLMPAVSDSFNIWGSNTTKAYLTFLVALKGAGTQRTLYSVAGTPGTSYFNVYIGTDNKVYFTSRYNTGTAYSVAHATALSIDTFYDIQIGYCNTAASSGWGYKLYIRIRDINGSTVGTDVLSNSVTSYSTSAKKSIGQYYAGATQGALGSNLFNGVMYGFYIQGWNYAGTGSTATDEIAFADSTVDSTTITGAYNWTIYGGATLQATG
jgi:hypothetical protein